LSDELKQVSRRLVQVVLDNDVDEICPDTYFVKETHFFGRADTVELKPGGASILLTNANKAEYAHLAARHTMTTAIKEPVLAFQRGLWEVRFFLDLVIKFFDLHCSCFSCGMASLLRGCCAARWPAACAPAFGRRCEQGIALQCAVLQTMTMSVAEPVVAFQHRSCQVCPHVSALR
jgi:HECT-domain (ubiquitin-transferase)